MPRLEEALRRAAASLDLPQPERTRILEEIAADLEELLAELRRGHRRRALLGVYASVLGVLGTVVGITIGAMAVEAVGEVHVRHVSGSMRRVLLHDHQTRRPARRHAHE